MSRGMVSGMVRGGGLLLPDGAAWDGSPAAFPGGRDSVVPVWNAGEGRPCSPVKWCPACFVAVVYS